MMPHPPLCIDRCVCFQVRFTALNRLAVASGAATLPDLQNVAEAAGTPFGQRCGLCHPYVRRMLATGKTVFTEVVLE